MKVIGIDLGSREVKISIMEDGLLVDNFMISTMSFYRDYCTYDGKINVDFKNLNIDNIDYGISTGYGRNNTNLSNFKPINELKAHVYGVMYQKNIKDFTLLDIGGQDVKIVKVESGIITDLELNDKCAASCGRYLEGMANILEVSLDEMCKYYEDPVELNSTCSVFSESELIGKMAEGVSFSRLCAGVNYSLYKRIVPLTNRFKDRNLIVSGGVAKNKAIISYLKADYENVILLDNPQFNGSIGCCNYINRKIK